jgi:DNA-binding NtrC family response regulator
MMVLITEAPMSPLTPTILLIEDDPSIQGTLAEVLRLEDYTLMMAATVEAAEDAWQRVGSGGLALVIADIHLTARRQASEGYQLYERWHRRAPQLPFLFMSAAPDGEELPAVRAGAVRFLAKPFAYGDLLQSVRAEIHRTEVFDR